MQQLHLPTLTRAVALGLLIGALGCSADGISGADAKSEIARPLSVRVSNTAYLPDESVRLAIRNISPGWVWFNPCGADMQFLIGDVWASVPRELPSNAVCTQELIGLAPGGEHQLGVGRAIPAGAPIGIYRYGFGVLVSDAANPANETPVWVTSESFAVVADKP